jgi:hypothetical protein
MISEDGILAKPFAFWIMLNIEIITPPFLVFKIYRFFVACNFFNVEKKIHVALEKL